jgi:Recombinase/Resolvase, N terminal domain
VTLPHPVTPVTPSRVTHASVAPWLLTGASLALAGVGITMNGWFARSLGSSDIAGWLFLAIGLAADATALALPSCAAQAWQASRRVAVNKGQSRLLIHPTRETSIIQAIVNSGLNWLGRWVGWTPAKISKPCTANCRRRGNQMTSAARLELVTPKPELIAALYRRYSSDVQNDRSIERQTADLEKAAPRLGLKLDERFYYEDRAQSATTLFDRPGLTRHLLGAAEKKLFDVVLVEHTDRLARKGADLFWLAEQFKFLRGPQGNPIKIFTPAGEVSDLQLTFESYQKPADSAKTSFRVRSGHNDAAREMLICNAAPYGDDDVLGKPGVKAPNKSEVEIVNRICRETAARMSPRNIAFGLTRDGVPSPNGGAWTFQTINKILQNQFYVGVYVRDKVRKIRNPNTGKRVPRPVAPEDWVTVEMPHLRIVDQDLWDAAQAVRQERASKTFGNKQVERATVARRLHPFAGLFRCAECGGKMIICGSARKGDRAIACSAAWWGSTCSHGKS